MELKKLLYAVDLEDAPHPAIEHVKMDGVPDGRFRFDRIRWSLPKRSMNPTTSPAEGQPTGSPPPKPCWKRWNTS